MVIPGDKSDGLIGFLPPPWEAWIAFQPPLPASVPAQPLLLEAPGMWTVNVSAFSISLSLALTLALVPALTLALALSLRPFVFSYPVSLPVNFF